MKAMILAAGRGERLRPLTDSIPKPLVPVHGKPLIEYHIEKLAAIGIKDIVINHAWLGDKIVDHLGDGSRWGVDLHFSQERTALETAGGIKQALPLLGDAPFFVINGDIYVDQLPIDAELVQQGASALLAGNQAHLWLVENPQHNLAGDFALQGSQVLLSGQQQYTFSGMAIYLPSLFDDLVEKAAPLGPLLKQKIAQQAVVGNVYQGYWCDVGTLARLEEVERRLAAKLGNKV
ncbi:N-acetylmuramate alpha-1-phosphate uridylyltransferase MurU [Shewanella waksmanii]|uniref:N-acetylmuramate alpha-1-phosphate uridylyltransferase MurU n=1 Tax=Shewanella waksmanii TaxID=213783 RepID=UPI003734C736